MKNKRLNLETLKVKSFITNEQAEKLLGGCPEHTYTNDADCPDTEEDCPNSMIRCDGPIKC